MPNLPTKNVLNDIMSHKALEVAARKQQRPQSEVEAHAHPLEKSPSSGPLEAAFRASKRAITCLLEVKPSSPSAGVLAKTLDLPALLDVYQQYGVGISVLTDKTYFGGSLELLQQVSNSVPVPTLCKDFILDPYQVYEARETGAKAALLIVKALSDAQLAELTSVIRSLGMTPLIEIQDEAELERSLAVEPTILLINNRNLQSLEIDLDTTERLAPRVPAGILRISASGIENRQDIDRLKPYCDGFLIGSLLMRQPSPAHAAAILEELTR